MSQNGTDIRRELEAEIDKTRMQSSERCKKWEVYASHPSGAAVRRRNRGQELWRKVKGMLGLG